jgi:hypothetical protein
VFCGTRIPVAALFQNLEDGVSLTEFVEIFPGVTTGQFQGLLSKIRENSLGLGAQLLRRCRQRMRAAGLQLACA